MRADRQTVRHMRVRGPSRARVMHIVPEIEDALATTSWPGQGMGRNAATVLQIRRIALPRLSAQSGRFAIARLIEAQIAQGAVQFASAEALPTDAGWIVWPNRTEMLVGAALAAVRDGPETMHWWQTAGVPEGAAPVTPEGFAKAVLLMSQPGGPDLVPGALLRLLEVMPQPQVRRWLTPVLTAWRAARPVPEGSADVQAVVAQMAETRAQKGLPALSDTDITAVVLQVTEVEARSLPPATRTKLMAVLRTAGVPPVAQIWLVAQVLIARSAAGAQAQILRRLHKALVDSVIVAASESPATPRENAPHTFRPQASPEPVPAVKRANRQDPAGPGPAASVPGVSVPAARTRTDEMTRLGGLVVLMNMLGHLKIPQADQTAGTDYALQLLAGFARRLTPEDALVEALPEAGPDPLFWLRGKPLPVFVPDLTLLKLKRPLSVHRLKGRQGCAALCLPGGRLCIGLLSAKEVQKLRCKTELRRGPVLDLPGADLHQRLLAGLSILVQHSLRGVGAGAWRAVLQRPGYLVHSVTHLDVTLDLEDIRLNERRVGLDASPGWLPWVGRVVSLHFERFDRPLVTHGGQDE